MSTSSTTSTGVSITADPELPIIQMTRDFRATPAQVQRAHADAALYARWVGPTDMTTEIDYWDARSGGSWAFSNVRAGERHSFRGCFHEVRQDRLVQTFTYLADPDGVALETITFEDLGDGRTRLHAHMLVDSFESRNAWLASGMEGGMNDGYAKLDALLAAGDV